MTIQAGSGRNFNEIQVIRANAELKTEHFASPAGKVWIIKTAVFKQGEVVLEGRYRIDGPAGEKKACTLFRGTRVADGRPVVVRLLAPSVRRQPHILARLRSRAESAMAMGHPNLVPVLETGETNAGFAIVEESFESLPLLELVRVRGACSPREAVWIATRLAEGVDHLIANGAAGFDFTLSDVHADIGDLQRKPEFFSMTVELWPGLVLRLNPLALDGEGFSERGLATDMDSGALVRSMAALVFHLVTGGMGNPLLEPVLSEKFTASLRACLTGVQQAASCRELLWTLFSGFGPEIEALLPPRGTATPAPVARPRTPDPGHAERLKQQMAALEQEQRNIREEGTRARAAQPNTGGSQALGLHGSPAAKKKGAGPVAAVLALAGGAAFGWGAVWLTLWLMEGRL